MKLAPSPSKKKGKGAGEEKFLPEIWNKGIEKNYLFLWAVCTFGQFPNPHIGVPFLWLGERRQKQGVVGRGWL